MVSCSIPYEYFVNQNESYYLQQPLHDPVSTAENKSVNNQLTADLIESTNGTGSLAYHDLRVARPKRHVSLGGLQPRTNPITSTPAPSVLIS